MAKVTFEIWDDNGEVEISADFDPIIQPEKENLTPAQALAVDIMFAIRGFEKDNAE